ncbi:hypothetical protein RFI_06152 [Reticulomyxa filosa]|uniref:Uncharacterized protein n=1 Tax=Reticulomyxa filosa TaxID=46433 RepID=X6NYB9_RETFI|nr:hypothetical protein RFI_06152 [Reticulomyxa filosa]|eukprot:ETO30966.1 hypothetical protein RFI_06152 [Reticulomyxa filosa]
MFTRMYLQPWGKTTAIIVSNFISVECDLPELRKRLPNDVLYIIVAFRFGTAHKSASFRQRSLASYLSAFRVVKYLAQPNKKDDSDEKEKEKKKKKGTNPIISKKEIWKMVEQINSTQQIPSVMDDPNMNILFVDKRTFRVIPNLTYPSTLSELKLHFGDFNIQVDANVLAAMAGDTNKWSTIMTRQHFYFNKKYYSIINMSEDTIFASWGEEHILIYQLEFMFIVITDLTSRLNPGRPTGAKYAWTAHRFYTETEKIVQELKNSGI